MTKRIIDDYFYAITKFLLFYIYGMRKINFGCITNLFLESIKVIDIKNNFFTKRSEIELANDCLKDSEVLLFI